MAWTVESALQHLLASGTKLERDRSTGAPTLVLPRLGLRGWGAVDCLKKTAGVKLCGRRVSSIGGILHLIHGPSAA